MKATIVLIAAVILLASSTPAIEAVIFKPQRPAAVHVKMFLASTYTQKEVKDYIEDACKKGWVVKAISQSYRNDIGANSYTVIFETY